ncbi:MAG: excinuclease ABC subunit UvrA, partial [Bacteroidota bacterium]
MKNKWVLNQIEALLKIHGFDLKSPLKDMPEEVINQILYGSDEHLQIVSPTGAKTYSSKFQGVISYVEKVASESSNPGLKRWAQSFTNKIPCTTCNGARLKKQALYFRIGDKNIAELASWDLKELHEWFHQADFEMNETQKRIAHEPLKEIKERLNFLMDVGLDYLSLNRSSRTLSGGEAQRIRLATQIGSKLVGVLYILDEPSIGLHQRDNERLIRSLKQLRDVGNTVIVVEHDKDMMLESDHLIDIGPGAGAHGGYIVAQGKPQEHLEGDSVTAAYLMGTASIPVPVKRRKGNRKKLSLTGATGHNLQNVNLKLPLGTFICVTGVSGSGKSSLIAQTLYPILHGHFYTASKKPLPYKKVAGLQHLDKVIEIDQSPIGRTPRSNPATYTGI